MTWFAIVVDRVLSWPQISAPSAVHAQYNPLFLSVDRSCKYDLCPSHDEIIL